MSRKINPKIFRTNVIYTWDSRTFAPPKKLAPIIKEDYELRKFLNEAKDLEDAGIDQIIIERFQKDMQITIIAARPGVIIGRAGKGIEDLQKKIERIVFKKQRKVRINVLEIKTVNLSAPVVARAMRVEIEKRLPFRRVAKQALERVMKAGALGVKIRISGRLDGNEIARSELFAAGKMPLATLRSNISYALAEAHTTYGLIGIKVWIYKGESFGQIDQLKAE